MPKYFFSKKLITTLLGLTLLGAIELCITMNKIFRDAEHSGVIAKEIGIYEAVKDYYRTYKKYPGNIDPHAPMPCILKKAPACRRDAQLAADNRAFWSDLSKAHENDALDETPSSRLTSPTINGNDFSVFQTDLGQFVVATTDGHAVPDRAAPGTKAPHAGLMLLLTDRHRLTTLADDDETFSLTPAEAYAFDRKLDDGRADEGWVIGVGASQCFNASQDQNNKSKHVTYNVTSDQRSCDVAFLFSDVEKP